MLRKHHGRNGRKDITALGGVLSSRRNIDRTHLNHFLYKTHARPTEEERLLRPHASDEELLVVDEGGRVIFFVVGGRC